MPVGGAAFGLASFPVVTGDCEYIPGKKEEWQPCTNGDSKTTVVVQQNRTAVVVAHCCTTAHVDVRRVKTHVEQKCLVTVAAVAMLFPTNLPPDGNPLFAAATAKSALHTQARLLEDAARTKLAVATALATHVESIHAVSCIDSTKGGAIRYLVYAIISNDIMKLKQQYTTTNNDDIMMISRLYLKEYHTRISELGAQRGGEMSHTHLNIYASFSRAWRGCVKDVGAQQIQTYQIKWAKGRTHSLQSLRISI